jgi:hypothetical protein
MVRSVVSLTVLLCACSGASVDARAPASDAREPSAVYEATWTGTGDLEVVIRTTGGFEEVSLEPGAEAFMTNLSVRDADGTPAAFVMNGTTVRIPACATACTIRYRLPLGLVADAFDDPEFAGRVGDVVFAPPTTWLLHPLGKPDGRFQLNVHVPDGVDHVSGLSQDAPSRFSADLADLPQAPYAAFGTMRRRPIKIGASTVDLAIAGMSPALGDDAIEAWVRAAATNVESYFGRFPVERAAVFVIVKPGEGVGHGTALGNGGSSILVRVGADTKPEGFESDWIMTHEIVHLSMPGLHARHNWMEEGLATYVEPLSRAQRGLISPEHLWSEWYYDMRQGLPAASDGGLDGTSSWGRTYWGGAIFWLLAELEIRDKTNGRYNLRDCLRTVVDSGGNIAVRWSAARFVDACDAALPEPIVRPLYERHAREAVHVDLDAIFARLGVRRARVGIELDDTAPAASLRRAITKAEDRVAFAP